MFMVLIYKMELNKAVHAHPMTRHYVNKTPHSCFFIVGITTPEPKQKGDFTFMPTFDSWDHKTKGMNLSITHITRSELPDMITSVT